MDSPDPTPHLERFDSYEQACREFRWQIPLRFNIAKEICRRHADSVTRIAIKDVREGGINSYTFGGLDFLSDKFATLLSSSGISPGDSVAVVLPPSAALVIAQFGALKAGVVVVQFSMDAGSASFERALAHCNARALIIDEAGVGKLEGLVRNLPELVSCFVVRDLRALGKDTNLIDFWRELDRASSQFDDIETVANAPAFIFYFDRQDDIAAVVHSHRSAIAQLAPFELISVVEFKSVEWIASNWSSPGNLLGMLYPSLWYGRAMITGTSIKDAVLQDEMLSKLFGTPETGWILGKCDRWFVTPGGSRGRPVPGQSIEIIDQNGNVLPAGQTGHIAVHRSDPGLFLEYHRAGDQTNASFLGDWFRTGDIGYKSGDGDFYSP